MKKYQTIADGHHPTWIFMLIVVTLAAFSLFVLFLQKDENFNLLLLTVILLAYPLIHLLLHRRDVQQ